MHSIYPKSLWLVIEVALRYASPFCLSVHYWWYTMATQSLHDWFSGVSWSHAAFRTRFVKFVFSLYSGLILGKLKFSYSFVNCGSKLGKYDESIAHYYDTVLTELSMSLLPLFQLSYNNKCLHGQTQNEVKMISTGRLPHESPCCKGNRYGKSVEYMITNTYVYFCRFHCWCLRRI